MKTIHEVNLTVFGDFTTVMTEAKEISSFTGCTVSFEWNSVKFNVKSIDTLDSLWDHYHSQLIKRK